MIKYTEHITIDDGFTLDDQVVIAGTNLTTALGRLQGQIDASPIGGVMLIGIQVFTSSGTYTPTTGTKSILVYALGGGGAGVVLHLGQIKELAAVAVLEVLV